MAWSYEQLFNGLSDGDLNGQDSWSGNTGFDVQSVLFYEGTKALEADGTTNESITRTITDVSSGTFYFSIRRSSTAGTADVGLRLLIGGNIAVDIRMEDTADFRFWNGSTKTVGPTWSVNTWYRIGITFNVSDSTWSYNIDNGSFSTTYSFRVASGGNDVDTIQLYVGNGLSTGAAYWDAISPDYTPGGGGTTPYRARQNFPRL